MSTGQPHSGYRRILLDSTAAVGLGAILVLVFLADLVSRPAQVAPQQSELIEVVDNPAPPKVQLLRLAVTPPEFDDMGKLLDQLGKGYKYTNITLDDLLDVKKLRNFDVVFMTCGTSPEHWVDERIGDGQRESQVYTWNEEVRLQLHDSLRNFVERGGTLYASDWRFGFLAVAFPELVSLDSLTNGKSQHVNAKVIDEGLKEIIGAQIDLHFDMDGWYPANFRSEELESLLSGQFTALDGSQQTAPLLVKMAHGEGTIIFTAFHNETVNSKLETELLKYLVFTSVTAQVDSRASETMVQGGFSPKKQNLLSTSSEEPSATSTYECTQQGDLKFVLDFANAGAEFQLIVESPTGEKYKRQDTSAITIEIPQAQVGTWRYTVTGIEIPYQNFPFVLHVGQK